MRRRDGSASSDPRIGWSGISSSPMTTGMSGLQTKSSAWQTEREMLSSDKFSRIGIDAAIETARRSLLEKKVRSVPGTSSET